MGRTKEYVPCSICWECTLSPTEQDRVYKELALAVVIQAAYDYKRAETKYKNAKHSLSEDFAKCELDGIEEFFLSQRFRLFADIDGSYLLRKIKMRGLQSTRGRNASTHI